MFNTAKKIALEKLRAAAESGELPDKVALTTYRDDETFRFFRPDEYEQGIAAKHEGAMADLAVEISREFPKVHVHLVPLSIEEYEVWISQKGLEDSPATRAMYATETEEVRGEEIGDLKKGKKYEN